MKNQKIFVKILLCFLFILSGCGKLPQLENILNNNKIPTNNVVTDSNLVPSTDAQTIISRITFPINQQNITISIGKTYALSPNIYPTNLTVNYQSSSPAIAAISTGNVITGFSVGVTTINCSLTYQNFTTTAAVVVTVENPLTQINIGQILEGNIFTATDEDLYKIEISNTAQSKDLICKITNLSTNLALSYIIYDAHKNICQTINGAKGKNPIASAISTTGDIYYIKVWSNNTACGEYKIEILESQL